MDEEKGIRLNKYIALAGVASRRDADKLIDAGKVTINGKKAQTGDRVFEGDSVKVGSKLIKPAEEMVVIAYYKPAGVTCTERDAHAEYTVKDQVRYKQRVTYAGRLDKDSEGLLIMTNNGDLIQEMMRGENGHEKEYVVKINKPVTQELIEKLSSGVFLRELNRKTKPCTVKKVSKDSFSIVLTQGLNRQIRRMCEACDVKVANLKRIRVLSVTLEGLKPNEYRKLSDAEVEKLYKEIEKTNSR